MTKKRKLMSKEMSEALIESDISTLVTLIENGESVNGLDGNTGQTLIIWAAENGYKDMARFFLSKGANLEERDVGGNTPLMCAALRGDIELVNLFLESGANPNRRNSSGGNAMFKTIVGRNIDPGGKFDEVVNALVQYGAKAFP
jgi:ankyrin repeat protein